jgi:hypothetical protein
MPLKNLADSLEAASRSVKRPDTPEAASDPNAAQPIFSANELEALMRGPVAPTNVRLPTQTMIIDAAMFQEMHELLTETKQQLQLRNQQIDQLQRAYTQHDSDPRALGVKYGENAEEGSFEDEEDGDEEEFLLVEEAPSTSSEILSEKQQRHETSPRQETERTEFYLETFGSPRGSEWRQGTMPESAAGQYGSTIAHHMQTPEFGNSGNILPIPSPPYQAGMPPVYYPPAGSSPHVLSFAPPAIHAMPCPPPPQPHPYALIHHTPMPPHAMQDAIRILSMEF